MPPLDPTKDKKPVTPVKPVKDPYAGMSPAEKASVVEQEKANKIAEELVRISTRGAEREDERYKHYKENYYPLEMEMIKRAKIGEDFDYNASRAKASQQFADQQAKESYKREMSRLGISPDDPRYASLADNWSLYKSAAEAGAVNMSRQQTADTNRMLKSQIAAMGTGIPGQSLSAYGAAGQGLAGAAATGLTGSQGVINAYNVGAQNSLKAAQFNADLASRINELNFGQQKLSANQDMFNMGMRGQQRMFDWGQQAQLYGQIGNLAGMGIGAGLGYKFGGGMGGAAGGGSGSNPYMVPFMMNSMGQSNMGAGYMAGSMFGGR